ncbi:hypothetical protein POM88_019817 [Heracleum sosnowskyi]|uniref:Uncharacterized protein n=1 Tax=Heracleum sosnowskyi TaxID=360622 RepID=A0AAD8MR70_9APIA|nr:hypothetical protein POM88_019817 [Heracleum sosnowskyi]
MQRHDPDSKLSGVILAEEENLRVKGFVQYIESGAINLKRSGNIIRNCCKPVDKSDRGWKPPNAVSLKIDVVAVVKGRGDGIGIGAVSRNVVAVSRFYFGASYRVAAADLFRIEKGWGFG